jgi:hypothetical protein
MMPVRSLTRPGKQPGKQIRDAVGIWESTPTQGDGKLSDGLEPSLGAAGFLKFPALPMPNVAARPLRPAFRCFPHASPVLRGTTGKQEMAPRDRSKPLISVSKFGAGEGIRTLDPNLVKVRNHCSNSLADPTIGRSPVLRISSRDRRSKHH